MHSVNHSGSCVDPVSDNAQSCRLLEPPELKKKEECVGLGSIVVARNVIKWSFYTLLGIFVLTAITVIIVNALPKHWQSPTLANLFNARKLNEKQIENSPSMHKHPATPPDRYTLALHKALQFFNAQKSGRLPKNNGVPWRGDSGLKDGSDLDDVKGGLIGGYHDGGDNIKFHFPMAFSMTLLSWSVVEYSAKYKDIGEYDHVRELIRWGTDYLLRTFDSTGNTKINHIYSQVGTASAYSNAAHPDDHFCWMRPEDMSYPRPVQVSTSAPDLGGEMAAALAAASIVFHDDRKYSRKLVKAAETVYKFARDMGHRNRYSSGNPYIEPFYNSTGYWDEYMWSATWMYYATGNNSYITFATDPRLPKNAKAFMEIRDLGVFSWDNKLPGAELLLTRFRLFLNPGYPYEETLRSYHNATGLNMCAYLKSFNIFNYTRGGLIQLNDGRPQSLQFAVNAAFLASLYADYLDAENIPGYLCGPYYFESSTLRRFATSQVNYILGDNPINMSYVVGYGKNYPKHVHHRGASIPNDGIKYSCTGGWKWRDTKSSNPNTVTGAMVGGPNRFDHFSDVRTNYYYTEPTIAGNAGLVAALISLTSTTSTGIDINTIFSAVPQQYHTAPTPPPPWKP